jgi:hypothetical protein
MPRWLYDLDPTAVKRKKNLIPLAHNFCMASSSARQLATISMIVMTGIAYLPALKGIPLPRLPVPPRFQPSSGRATWLVDPIFLPSNSAIAIVIIPAIIVTVLIFFYHNVSSLIAQSQEFRLEKPSANNWNFIVFSISILITSLLGLPLSSGLIPQARYT